MNTAQSDSSQDGVQPPALSTASLATLQRPSRTWLISGMIVWGIGLAVLIVSSVIVHNHPGPWPIDLQVTRFVQHLQIWAWASDFLVFINYFNNGIEAGAELLLWFVVLLVLRLYRYALFIGLGTAICDAVNGLLGNLVARPRPSPHLVHVTMAEPTFSFPSGHMEHCIVYYGLLLYISFSPPLRRWRYRWVLIPFQVLAVLTILLIGFARIVAGSHWFTDVLAGVLSGILLLTVSLLAFRWAGTRFPYRARKR